MENASNVERFTVGRLSGYNGVSGDGAIAAEFPVEFSLNEDLWATKIRILPLEIHKANCVHVSYDSARETFDALPY